MSRVDPNKIFGEIIMAMHGVVSEDKELQMKKINEITKAEAQSICEAHDIFSMLESEEEYDLLADHNPDLLLAYEKLRRIADK